MYTSKLNNQDTYTQIMCTTLTFECTPPEMGPYGIRRQFFYFKFMPELCHCILPWLSI